MDLETRLNDVVAALNVLERERFKANGHTLAPDPVHWRERKKFISIDYGTSGAFLVEVATGELFNIKGYGVPDKNKKKKSDLGNIFTVDVQVLHGKRYNYLRKS